MVFLRMRSCEDKQQHRTVRIVCRGGLGADDEVRWDQI